MHRRRLEQLRSALWTISTPFPIIVVIIIAIAMMIWRLRFVHANLGSVGARQRLQDRVVQALLVLEGAVLLLDVQEQEVYYS